MDKQTIKKIIKEKDIHTIRVEFPDLHGVSRNKSLPANRIDEIIEEGITSSQVVFAVMLNNDISEDSGVADEVSYSDMKIIPDLNTFTIVPYLDGTARMIGDIYVKDEPFAQSPRWLLKRVIKQYNELGLCPIAASELEFYIYRQGENGLEPYADSEGTLYTTSPRTDPLGIMSKLQSYLLEMGFDVLYYNNEYFAGQYEFNWKHSEALVQADQSFTFKNVCKELGYMHDLHFTFMGRPSNEAGGSGFHIHFSLDDLKTGVNCFEDTTDKYGMSALMRHFIAGQIRHAEGMTAFLAPTTNSYKRFMRDAFAPYFIGWGLDNRTTYIRVPDERGKATRVELRAACASANPYLALATALISGLDGIKKKLDPGEPFLGDLYRENEGHYKNVPLSLYRSLKNLEKDEVLNDAIGSPLINNFLSMKTAEVEAYRTNVTDWEVDYYSYHM
ncbi:glutamine synthetase family protein [Desulfobacter curvatus]|uniref:glutamine synthetase family protein n=1 Tax=Desulfobacter curvatus TaxID=2290 RepID=UPI000365A8C8|nr:glutamine synthetase family protein [Desulfobacter curvatus]